MASFLNVLVFTSSIMLEKRSCMKEARSLPPHTIQCMWDSRRLTLQIASATMVEKLKRPTNLRWNISEFSLDKADFVVRFMIVDKHVTLTIEGMLIDYFDYFSPVWNKETILPFLSELGHQSFDYKVHCLIRLCYELCDELHQLPELSELPRSLARSCNKYVLNILCTEKMELVPFRYSYRFITWCLQLSCVPEVPIEELRRQTLNVSKEVLGNLSELKGIVLEFMDGLYLYPLNMYSKFPKRPGVYFIYYVGKTKLYEGSQVSPSSHHPVYVGQSQTDIANRLSDHRTKIEKADKSQVKHEFSLDKAEFVVRFMIVNKHSARAIEGMLIEHFRPVWNKETKKVGFSFGNANSKRNTWNKFHIQGNIQTTTIMLQKLRISPPTVQNN
ncbi:hypothetical protein OS493_038293 [Desmophyllum pertusum]|uniref:GIY-YIG domain-containing protein n=1 Tax=Desmophyllum pertusum TaxID=174260 RepID=A0A9W9ZHM7_9CNID|nr:hypothetical protein OS493_038293 [Desmophyllum pertusum]